MLGPIFMREFVTVPRRTNHYVARSAALGLLWILGLTAWQASVGFSENATLGDTARFGLRLFQIFAFVELTLVLFFAALSAANTVAQEKDRRTFVLLLITDMRDYEIVLGKLLGSLLPIGLLVLGTVPVLALGMLLGGVAPHQVVEAVVVVTATAVAAGSVGGLVALWRERTFQALALSTLFLVLYINIVEAVGLVPALVNLNPEPWHVALTWLQPFRAMAAVVEPPAAPPLGIPPAYGYAICMTAACVLLNGFGILKLRRWNPSGEPIMQREKPADENVKSRLATLGMAGTSKEYETMLPSAYASTQEDEDKNRAAAHAAPGPVRAVWKNPILWREVGTLAYGRRPVLVKLAYVIALALICLFAYSKASGPGGKVAFAAAYGLIPLAILSLLLIAAQAVTSITAERDGRTLDLLLVTDLSPQEFIFGKILGVLYNVKEYLLPPLVLAGVYAVLGDLATPPRAQPELAGSMNLRSFLAVAGGLVLVFAFAVMLGLHVALRNILSRLAIVNTLGTVFFLSVGTLICIYLIMINGNFRYQWASFVLFLGCGIGGLWWVLSADRPSPALTLAAFLCPLAMFYVVTNVLIANPGTEESADPLIPFVVLAATFGFTIAGMLVPLLSEFDVALGRTSAPEEG